MSTGERAVEIILARALMSHLTTPAVLVDAAGTLVFFNDPAAQLLGMRYEEAGPMAPDEWRMRFSAREDRLPTPDEELPLMLALNEQRPSYRRLRICSMNGEKHEIEASAFPIMGSAGIRGAMAIFWRTD